MNPLLLISLLLSLSSLPGNAQAARARFEPPPGKILLLVGQNLEDIDAYHKASKVVPAGFMSYTSVQKVDGLTEPSDYGNGTSQAQKLVDQYPNTVLQIGLYMVDGCSGTASGEFDSQIDELGAWIKQTRRPVYLRVGYEFDGPHNHYPPQDYVTAYRYIVDRLRARKVNNVAFVWHSYASTLSKPLMDWYPGDAYVDWVGISYFNQPQSFMLPMVALAKKLGKPVMICESSPWGVQTKYPNSWNLWFAPLFKFIAANDIKALSYISSDWDSSEMFKNEKWGDTRLQSNPEILRRWLEETAQERYLKSSPTLFQTLGFDPK